MEKYYINRRNLNKLGQFLVIFLVKIQKGNNFIIFRTDLWSMYVDL